MEIIHSRYKVKHRVQTNEVINNSVDDNAPTIYRCELRYTGGIDPTKATSVCVFEHKENQVVFRNDVLDTTVKRVDLPGKVLKLFVSDEFRQDDGQVVVIYQGKDPSEIYTVILKYGGSDKIVRKSFVKKHIWNKYDESHSSVISKIMQGTLFNMLEEEPTEENRAEIQIKNFKAVVGHTGSWYSNSEGYYDRISTNNKEIKFVAQVMRNYAQSKSAVFFGCYRLISRASRINRDFRARRSQQISKTSWNENYSFISTSGYVDSITFKNGYVGIGVSLGLDYLIYFKWRNPDTSYFSSSSEENKSIAFHVSGGHAFCFSKSKMYVAGSWGNEVRIYDNFQAKYCEALSNASYMPLRYFPFSKTVMVTEETFWRGVDGKLAKHEAETVQQRYLGHLDDFERFELKNPDRVIAFGGPILSMKSFCEGPNELLGIVTTDEQFNYVCTLMNVANGTILFNQKFCQTITDFNYHVYQENPIEGVLNVELAEGKRNVLFELPLRGVDGIRIINAHMERVASSATANDRVSRHIDI